MYDRGGKLLFVLGDACSNDAWMGNGFGQQSILWIHTYIKKSLKIPKG